jgi:hypothetical protein
MSSIGTVSHPFQDVTITSAGERANSVAGNRSSGLLPWRDVGTVKNLLRPLYRRTTIARVSALEADLAQTRQLVAEMHRVLMELNHEIRGGGEQVLPLFLGAADRLRLDADTAIAVTEVIERQLALLDARLERFEALAAGTNAAQ